MTTTDDANALAALLIEYACVDTFSDCFDDLDDVTSADAFLTDHMPPRRFVDELEEIDEDTRGKVLELAWKYRVGQVHAALADADPDAFRELLVKTLDDYIDEMTHAEIADERP